MVRFHEIEHKCQSCVGSFNWFIPSCVVCVALIALSLSLSLFLKDSVQVDLIQVAVNTSCYTY